MTNTTDFTNLVEAEVSDVLDSAFLSSVYFSVIWFEPEEMLTDLTGSTIDNLATDISNAGVDADTVSYFEGIFSDYSDTVFTSLDGLDSDLFNYKAGNNTLVGDASNNIIASVDTVNSSLSGNDGADILVTVGEADNTVSGGDGDDFITNVGTGNNTLSGNSGADTIVNISTGNNTLNGGNGSDLLVNVGTGNNTLNGGNGADILINYGSGAALNGNNGNDILIGGSGEDTVTGGNGNDILTGGDGADTFQFSAEYSSSTTFTYKTIKIFGKTIKIPTGISHSFGWKTSGSDTLTDFNPDEDIIEIDITDTVGTASSDLSFNSSTSQLSVDGNVLVTLDGVTNFDVNDVQLV